MSEAAKAHVPVEAASPGTIPPVLCRLQSLLAASSAMWDASLLLCAVTTSAHISELDQHVSVLENRGAMRMPNATVLRASFDLPRVGLGTGGLKG